MTNDWLELTAIVLVAAAAALAFSVGLRSARSELRNLEVNAYPLTRPLGEDWLAAATDVQVATPRGVTLRGWRGASKNGAGIVLVGGFSSDRTQLLPEARILSEAGYGVLVFDLPGVGESGGAKRRGDEQDFVRLGVQILASAPDVQPGRIGAYGFSTGAAFLAAVSARDDRIRAVVLAGCYAADTDELVRHAYRRWGMLSSLPPIWVSRLCRLLVVNPLADVLGIAPRPVLLIQGEGDSIVPPGSLVRLYAAAAAPKDFWIVQGADHRGFAEAAPEEYPRKLREFFDRALLGHDETSMSASPARGARK
jgi:uncharacterized protein